MYNLDLLVKDSLNNLNNNTIKNITISEMPRNENNKNSENIYIEKNKTLNKHNDIININIIPDITEGNNISPYHYVDKYNNNIPSIISEPIMEKTNISSPIIVNSSLNNYGYGSDNNYIILDKDHGIKIIKIKLNS